MTLTEKLEYRRLGESGPLGYYLTLNEVFDYFEEVICKPFFDGEQYTIHKRDIVEGGKFERFANYTIKRFGKEFSVLTHIN